MMKLISAEVVAYDNGIYRVQMQDDTLGMKDINILMVHYSREYLHSCIAKRHKQWVADGNGNPVPLPVVDLDLVHKMAEEAGKVDDEQTGQGEGLGVGSNGGDSGVADLDDHMGLSESGVTDDDARPGEPDGIWSDGGGIAPAGPNPRGLEPDAGGDPAATGPEAAAGQASPDDPASGGSDQPGDTGIEGAKASRT